MELLYNHWERNQIDMNFVSFHLLRNRNYEAFKWCLECENFYVNLERCRIYVSSQNLNNEYRLLLNM